MRGDAAAKLVWKNATEFHAALKQFDSRRRPVAETAAKIELYRLMGLMKQDLRAGRSGGDNFAPLRVISRGTRAARKPLSPLAVAVRYLVSKKADQTVMSVGFAGPQSSASWRRIAHRVQEGGEIDANMRVFGTTLRRLFAMVGGGYAKGRGKTVARYYFLRKTTQKLQLPARPIIAPFWRQHEREAEANIQSNFVRKLRGETI